jgi:A/G-specific adenine glycosylase
VRHAYTHFKIVLHVFACTAPSGRIRLNGPVDFKWVKRDTLHQFPFPKANLKFMHLLK